MNTQPVQTSIARDTITLTLSPAEQDALMRCLYVASLNEATINDARYIVCLSNKLKFLLPNSGDACRHSVQSPDVVGQGGTILELPLVGSDALPMVEYYQDQIQTYGLAPGQGSTISCFTCAGLGHHPFLDGPCIDCSGTGLVGQGDTL